MAIFFTADTHFGHDAIRKHCDRPFDSVQDMDRALIANWNSRVSPRDTVYHLGDFAFKGNSRLNDYVSKLNGTIHLVKGNHDPDGDEVLSQLFASVSELCSIKIDGERIVLCHYAMRTWDRSHHGSWHLYGHSHGTLEEDMKSLSFDVGVDCHNYFPVSFEEVKNYLRVKSDLANN